MRKILTFLTLALTFIFVGVLSSCGSDDEKLSLVAPQGAPAVAVADLAANSDNNISFIDAGIIGEQFTANEYDFIIAPINAGAKLYNKGKSDYKIVAVVTWGNLFIATQRSDIQTVADLEGKTVTIFGEATINGTIEKYVLDDYNVTYNTLGTAQLTQSLLTDDANAIVVTAEPALTAAKTKLSKQGKTVTSFSVKELFEAKSNGLKYTQAGLFVKGDTLKNKKEDVDNFIEKIKESCDKVKTDLDSVCDSIIALENTGLPNQKPIILSAIPNCNIEFKYAIDVKEDIEAIATLDIERINDPTKDNFGGILPDDDFYYNK